MNVALFASAFYPHVGGVEELVRQLAHAYRDRGVSAIVLTNRWPRSLPFFEEYQGIPVYRLALRVPEGSLKARVNYHLTHRAIFQNLLGILRKHDIDLLHVQCVSSNGYYALQAKRALGLPLVVTTQGERTMDAAQIYQRSPLMNRTLCALLAEADFITACSQNTLDDMEDYYGTPFGPRARVIYNGINLNEFAQDFPFQHPRPYILGMGRLVPQKGFDVLIRAFAQANVTNCDLLLAGDGPERAALETVACENGVQDRVCFLGRADRPTAVSLFQGCDFFVVPSRQEPQGIVNLEAMAAGKAVIASRVGGIPEVVQDGQTGLLVPGEDVEALAQAVTHLAADPGLRLRLGQAGRERAQQFAWPTIADQYLALYEQVRKD